MLVFVPLMQSPPWLQSFLSRANCLILGKAARSSPKEHRLGSALTITNAYVRIACLITGGKLLPLDIFVNSFAEELKCIWCPHFCLARQWRYLLSVTSSFERIRIVCVDGWSSSLILLQCFIFESNWQSFWHAWQ